jgi:hypothetical protein
MPSHKTLSYGLYQTLCSSEESPNMSFKKVKDLSQRLSNLSYDQIEAVCMLICEHARQNNDFVYDPENINLPYSIVAENNKIEFDVQNLPVELQYILWKFTCIIKENKNE